ncbi:RidA family protein [Paenibacillus sp. L3-i20]|uniref:RidA family protein n=1 Tax=Paenibacillus sp. L3-i20 TaxID=2905833 RepID=UPI001EE108D0|nr:Rid family hydrolase [Paenibacillus sp. L3-i20]
MNNHVVSRNNPNQIAKPVGNYSHVTKINRNAEMYVFSGQIGNDQDGHIPSNFNEQVTHTMSNIVALLSSQGLTPANVIKINIWATEEIDWDHFDSIWNDVFGDTPPSMTIAYISGLGLPELKIELDVWAAG